MKTTSNEMPKEVVRGNHLGQPQYTINFNVTMYLYEGPDPDGTINLPLYEYNSVTLPPGKFDYDTIVSALVNEIYPSDRMQAVQNNYLANPDDKDIKAEFDEMQEWRNMAKKTAKYLLEEYR